MKTILVIEDNREMRENTAEILELAHYNVITAVNGREGVEKARKQKPDLILCDIMMPEMDGYGVLYYLSPWAKVWLSEISTGNMVPSFLTAESSMPEPIWRRVGFSW